MARIAYVDHSFHTKTLSTQFLPDLLKRQGNTVDFFWCEQWKQGKGVNFDAVSDYDAVVMFQVNCLPLQYYGKKHPNITFIPMLDSYGTFRTPERSLVWAFEPFQGCKVLSFSRAIHYIASAFGIYSLPVRYFQAPVSGAAECSPGLHGFFWLRHEGQITWAMVRALIGQTPFASLHLHIAPDPGSPEPALPTEEECRQFSITTSRWFETKEDFYRTLARANVFFAPRNAEGIGQSFLEAMARGQCVVAPDNGTMNEYILHGVNGLLYNQDNPRPLDFSPVDAMGKNALESVRVGYASWVAQEKAIADFVLTPSESFYANTYRPPHLDWEEDFPQTSDVLHYRMLSLKKVIRTLPLVRSSEPLWIPILRVVKRICSPLEKK